jgi:CBS-domain-containing membrane protein
VQAGRAVRRLHGPSVVIERSKLWAALVGSIGGALAIAAMQMYSANAQFPLVAIPFATGTFHPPAGIDPLVVVVNGMPQSFLLVPVAAGALLLAAFAFAWHNIVARAKWGEGSLAWPVRWW